MKRWLPAAVALLLLNGAYLYSFDSPTLFYVTNVFLHLGLGLVLAALGFRLLSKWRQFSMIEKGAALFLALGTLSGLALVVTGTPRPYQWLVVVHIGLFLVGILLLIGALVLRRSAWPVLVGSLIVSVVLPLGVRTWYRHYPEPSWAIKNPTLVPTKMEEEGAGPQSPFFPSSSNTDVNRTIPSAFFMKPESCAAGRLSSGHLQAVVIKRASLFLLQQPVVSKVDRVHAGRCRDEAIKMVCRLS